ncbi:hypothetical protein N9X37_03630 [Planktomarina temperata]|nr:hypothetical protein [Planktomarina temperata]
MFQYIQSLGLALLLSVGIGSVGQAADCSTDPNECTPKKLCQRSTVLNDGNPSWSTDTLSLMHVQFAQSLGMTCGVITITDPCDLDPNECKISQLCGKATIYSNGQTSWDDAAQGYVDVAKEYGMSCDVKAKVASNLPNCKGIYKAATWTNCFGIKKYGSSIYAGEFKHNKRHGQGTYSYADGTIKEGIWEDDEFQYDLKNLNAVEPLADFTTSTGECSISHKKNIQIKYLETSFAFDIPKSYITKKTPLLQHSGAVSPSGNELGPLRPVLCLANAPNKVLVTSADPNDRACGWVSKSDLAKVAQLDPAMAPCGEVRPLKVKDFCNIVKGLENISPRIETLTSGCNLEGVKDTFIDTKFIPDNTTSRRKATASTSVLTMRDIPIFATAASEEPFGSVDIFSVNRVFDAKQTNGGMLRVLIGESDVPRGWTDLDNGHIWYSTLTTYFKKNGNKPIYLQKIVDGSSDQENQVLAQKPSAQSFNVKDDFVKFPVLFDMRKRDPMIPKFQAPQLEVAFIGKFCNAAIGQVCAGDHNKHSQALSNLRSANVVFLIDGSMSMSEYFGLVAESLTNFTEEYLGNPNYRFGVATYGHFKSAENTNVGDQIDYGIIMNLEPNYLGNFDHVAQPEHLNIEAFEDRPEATNAAVFQTAKSFNWGKNNPNFLIHIADSSDRQQPSQKVFDALSKNNIFYVPIAVEGEGILSDIQEFIDNSDFYVQNYTTKSGSPMAVSAIKSYGDVNANARESIARALVEATGGWPDLSTAASDGDILPVLDAAAKEIFKIPDSDDIQLLAATGYIETAPIGSIETNWDYFVSLNEKNAMELDVQMRYVCDQLGVGDSTKIIQTTVFNLVQLLTGDLKPIDELIRIWREGAIPLQTETIIGSGITDLLLAAATDQDLTPYKKEFCRSSLLLRLMRKNFKLETAEENIDMDWRGDRFEPNGQVKFNWRIKDPSGATHFDVPVNYLPRSLI